jgi:hypothetical protein
MKAKNRYILAIVLAGAFCCNPLYAADVYGHAKVQKQTGGGKRCPATQQETHLVTGACSAAVCQGAANTAQVTLQARLTSDPNTAHCTAIVLHKCECDNNGTGPKNVVF